jgi:hypothetical protein
LRTSKNPANDAINAGKENHPSIASVLGGCTNIPFMPSGGKQVLFFQLFMIKRRIGFKMDPARSMDDGNGWQGDMISIQMGAATCQNTPSHFDTYIFNIL